MRVPISASLTAAIILTALTACASAASPSGSRAEAAAFARSMLSRLRLPPGAGLPR